MVATSCSTRSGLTRNSLAPIDSSTCQSEGPPTAVRITIFTVSVASSLRIAAVSSFCYRRLQKLEARFKLHVMEHESAEISEQRDVPHRDF